MTWKIRHEGSPRAIEGLTLPQVVEGLQDGLWEPTDEIMGPDDRQWVAIESHPQLADAAADVEAPPPKVHEDETRLDMNPLIDVALVLLIFFILTTSYAALQKVLEMPSSSSQDARGKILTVKERVAQLMIKVTAEQDKNGPLVLHVEDKPVDLASLGTELSRFAKASQKTQILIDARGGVTWGTLVAIQDAAKGAGIERAYILNHKPAGSAQ
jgi:biopolymer transport protein ExbD